MKEQFSGSPNEDAASHLNTFIELCDMQKKKENERKRGREMQYSR